MMSEVPYLCRGGQSTVGSKKNFPPGNFCMVATGREKIARHFGGTVGEIFFPFAFFTRNQSILQDYSLRNNLHFVAQAWFTTRVSWHGQGIYWSPRGSLNILSVPILPPPPTALLRHKRTKFFARLTMIPQRANISRITFKRMSLTEREGMISCLDWTTLFVREIASLTLAEIALCSMQRCVTLSGWADARTTRKLRAVVPCRNERR